MKETITKSLQVFLITIFLVFFNWNNSFGSHQLASELTYSAISQDTYLVTFNLYRDCSGATGLSTYQLQLLSPGCNTGRTVTMNRVGSGQGVIGNPYCSATSNVCTSTSVNYEFFTFQAVVTFSPAEKTCTNWTLSVLLDGFRPQTANLYNQYTMYVETTLLLGSTITNNSAVFNTINPTVPITNKSIPVTISNVAYDPDGDSLAYSLVPALMSANTPVVYGLNYSYSNPTNTSLFSLDPKKGELSFVAPNYSTFGQDKNKYTIAIKVEEWRRINGITTKVGSIMRDMVLLIRDSGTNSNPTLSVTFNNQPLINNMVVVRPGSPVNLVVTGSDSNPADIVQVTTDATTNLPGSTFTTSGTSNVGNLNWLAPTSISSDKAYYFIIKAMDNACPLMGYETRTVGILVSNSRTTTWISDESNINSNIIAFPNPSRGIISLKLSNSKLSQVAVYNVLGQCVYTKNVVKTDEKERLQLDLSKEARGVYTIHVLSNNQITTRKVVLQ